MAADPTPAAERAPRRARYLVPRDLPHRAEVVAALGVLALLAHLLFAQVTLVVAVAFHTVSKASRWRPQWLLVPAAAGLTWILVIGPAAALAGFTAGSRAAAGVLAALITDPGRVTRLAALAALPRLLPGQLPAGLTVAAAEAAAAWWAGWLHTDEWDVPPARPGLAVLARQRVTGARVRAGGVLTRDGASLGLDQRTGRRAAVTWQEAQGGMLVTGASWDAVAAAGAQVVHAAIRRRKPVIAVDLAGDPAFAASLAAACAGAGAPLQVFGAAGPEPGGLAAPGYYEPLQGGSPARKASLITGMIDWTGRPEAARRDCAAILTDIFALAAAAPAGPGTAVLDDVISLLNQAALRSRLDRVPPYHPRRTALAGRIHASAARLAADPEPAAAVARQLTALRAAPLGQWLEAGPPAGRPGSRISLAGVVRDRGVALFPLGRAGRSRPAEMIATVVALDAAGLLADLHRTGIAGDGLAWFGRCEAADPAALAALLAASSQAGLACVFGTTSPQLATWLAGQVRVLAAHRLGDRELAGVIAPLTGTRLARVPGMPPVAGAAAALPTPAAALAAGPLAAAPAAGLRTGPATGAAPPPAATGTLTGGGGIPLGVARCPVVPAEALCALRDDEFTLIAGGRVVPLARAVPARIPALRPVRPARLARLSAAWPGSGLPGAGQARDGTPS